jgi:hypothetical protein
MVQTVEAGTHSHLYCAGHTPLVEGADRVTRERRERARWSIA